MAGNAGYYDFLQNPSTSFGAHKLFATFVGQYEN